MGRKFRDLSWCLLNKGCLLNTGSTLYRFHCIANVWYVFSLVEEGFFCQTTTSEERDFKRALVGQSEDLDEGLERDSYLMEDTVDQCYPLSPHETEDETSRYATSSVRKNTLSSHFFQQLTVMADSL